MTKPTIDELLSDSDPWAGRDDANIRDGVQRLVQQTQADEINARSRRVRKGLWVIPVVGLGGLALTAGALVVDHALFPDLSVPIEYVTDTDVTVSCTAQIEGGSMFSANSGAVVKYFEDRDTSGYGQQIYEHALVLTGDVEPTSANTPPSNSWIPGDGNWLDDTDAFNMSLVDYLVINTQIDLDLSGDGGWLTSDCTGQLH